jgi:hypothetical protein
LLNDAMTVSSALGHKAVIVNASASVNAKRRCCPTWSAVASC